MGFLATLPERWFGLDTRSLAAFRIGFGVIVVLDVLNRIPDLIVHYTDAGALPRWAVAEHLARIEHVSFHMASGSGGWIAFLFAVQLIAGLALMVGFHTKLATAICWALTVSLHNRNPLVLHSGDVIIRLMLFWAMFLPLGARWSIDARRPLLRPEPPTTFTSVGSAGFLVQLASVYVFTWALKTGDAWHDGTAVYYTLQIDHFAKHPQSAWMLQHLDVLELLTNATIVFEITAPALLLVPFFKGPLRTALVFGFWGLHLGFFAFMELGLFSWTCIVAWTAVLPGWFWDRLRVRARAGRCDPAAALDRGRRGVLSDPGDVVERRHDRDAIRGPPTARRSRPRAAARSEMGDVRALPTEGRRVVRDRRPAPRRHGDGALPRRSRALRQAGARSRRATTASAGRSTCATCTR